MKSFTLQQFAEGIKPRHAAIDRARLIEKWTKSGLLRGLEGHKRETMAQLLENQAVQVIKESAALSTGAGALASSGQITGLSSVAFPIVRRIFGGLIANEIVSIQAMNMPSGLIFYLDYTYGSNVGGDAGVDLSASSANETYTRGQSIYNNPPGRGVQSGSLAAGGMYDIVGSGYSRVHSGSANVTLTAANVGAWVGAAEVWVNAGVVSSSLDFTGSNARFASFDPQVESALQNNDLDLCFVHLTVSDLATAIPNGDPSVVDQVTVTGFATAGATSAWGETYQAGTGVLNLRRLNKRGNFSAGVFTPDAMNGTHIQTVIKLTNASTGCPSGATCTVSMVKTDIASAGEAAGSVLTIPSFESNFGSTPSPVIPEIDIKIESIAIVAETRKLRARWTPELAQDLNAYHSTDAEVEMTSVLSEQVALEIDREILNDLVTLANGANYYWSRAPGVFVDRRTGRQQALSNSLSIGPAFTGNVQDWYQTLVETISDVANTIHRKTLRGSANFVVTSPDVSTILEHTVFYKPKYSIDSNGQISTPMVFGAEAVGTINNRYTLYKDPYFPVNKLLVGFKGSNYLESGYIYSPYIPLIVTPTIFQPDDFTPRKGVMTRYGKKMIRSDFFGTITVLNMNII
jgi:hypothetical protein